MVVRTYFTKNNTIVSNSDVNTGLNPVTQLFYGGAVGEQRYSRFIFSFDENRLVGLYTGGTFADIGKLRHTLRMTNTSTFDKSALNGDFADKHRASSFDLILFKVGQEWDNGVGYDYDVPLTLNGEAAYYNGASNWSMARTGVQWTGGTGVYSGSPSGITVTTQHFDLGNENIEMDVTEYVNTLLTGATNNGLGVAFDRTYEVMETIRPEYVGFFTNNTQTFFEPFIETVYDNHINDDRNNFFLDKQNKLYLYVNINGTPTNLDTLPTVTIKDGNDVQLSAYTQSAVTHVTKGVYSIDITIPTTQDNVGVMYYDEWAGIIVNGISRPNITLQFPTRDSMEYYNIGSNDMLPKKAVTTISGINDKEKIKRGDIRRVTVSARIPYTLEQTQLVDELEYRVYVLEGKSEYTVIDYQPVERAVNYYYFNIDTESLLPNEYYIDIRVKNSNEVVTTKKVTSFEIINEADHRIGR